MEQKRTSGQNEQQQEQVQKGKQGQQAQKEQKLKEEDDDIIWSHYQNGKAIGKVTNKQNFLQSHMHGFKEQLFLQFSIFEIEQKHTYLQRCQKIIDFIEKKQRGIMMENTDTQYLEEEIQNYVNDMIEQNVH